MKYSPFLFLYRRPLFLLLIYAILSFLLMNFNDPRALVGVRGVALQLVEFIADIRHDISLWKDYQGEARRLRLENTRLKLKNQKYEEILLENARLRALLNLSQEDQHEFIAARVIGFGIELGVRSLILNVGERQGIKENMPVVNGDGLVGKIIAVTPNQAITQILMDHNSLVSARLQHSREAGVISWSGNSWLNLLYIAKEVPVMQGELVITSGLSQIYPADLKIGIVTHIEKNEYDLFQEIRVSPAVNFKALEEVIVLKTSTPGLRETLSGE